VVTPELMVKCCPSILKPSAVTEIRYFPGGRLPSAALSFRSASLPWATIGANPEVGLQARFVGHFEDGVDLFQRRSCPSTGSTSAPLTCCFASHRLSLFISICRLLTEQ
jgi:hypothetical protein